ncbi:MAG: hypothetical protein Q4A27_02510 [bacterium]|nr:hypothetical protein [bacterium]
MNEISIRINEARERDAQAYHKEISQKIREIFAKLSSVELKNAIELTKIGKAYIVEMELSDLFKQEDVYYINNTLRMSPRFNCVKRIAFFEKGGKNFARVWIKGDVKKFLPLI